MSRPAGTSMRPSCWSGHRHREVRRARRCPAWDSPPGRRRAVWLRGRSAAYAARRGRVPPPPGRGHAGVPARPPSIGDHVESQLTTEVHQRRGDRGVTDHQHPRAGQHRLEEHFDRTSRKAGILNGHRSVGIGRTRARPAALLAERQDPKQHRLAALHRHQRVGPDAVLGADSADEPVDRPVLEHQRDASGSHAGGSLGAHHRGGCEYRAFGRELLGPPGHGRSHHCGGSGLPCIAAHTRAGVQGMSTCSTPWVSYSASMTAFTIAGGDPTLGDSPTPLAPRG